MNKFTKIGETLESKVTDNDNNDIYKYKLCNDINVNSKYALNKEKFIPNTEGSILAEDIAKDMNDLNNYAYYFSVVNKLGVVSARVYWKRIQTDILEKQNTKNPVRFPKKYFAYMLKFFRKQI